MPLPSFVIPGAQKCGTTTLVATLRQHPQVFMARPKELHFFTRHPKRGLDWYADQFRPDERHLQWGEATPTYLFDEEGRTAMCEALPDARFVIILRDPVRRAYSQFWHSRRMGVEPLETFEEGLAAEPERLASDKRKPRFRFSYVARGHYIDQLEALERLAGRERMHVMLLEDLISDRVSVLEGLFDYLAIERSHAATIEERWRNPYRVADKPGEKAAPAAYPPMDPRTRSRLQEHFQPDNERLSRWLGRDLGEWSGPGRS